jgi:putative endonuclease
LSHVPVKSDPATWSDRRQVLGLAGEKAAMRFLRAAGWVVLHHRFRLGRLEIDLIARKGSTVAFIEVKTRLGPRFGSPLQAVPWRKQREIGRVAQAWMDRHGSPGETYRFDVIGITRTGPNRTLQHVADAFRLGR